MGRRGADTGGIEASAKTWEAVRRALGRLFTHAQVQELPEDRRLIAARVQSSEAVSPPVPIAGAGEKTWRPSASVSAMPIPRADPGGGNQNLLPAVRLAAPNCALAPPEIRLMPPPIRVEDCSVVSIGLLCPVEVTRLPDAFVKLPLEPILVQSRPLLAAPRLSALESPRLAAPKTGVVRIPRAPAPRVLWGRDAVLSRMALTRRGRDAPPDVLTAQAFEMERRRLAETAGLALEDVTLLGVYPHVPILAVSRIVVEGEGHRLRLWLKPEVLRARGSLRLITLLVGRRVSDGKMLQAAF